MSGSDSSDGAVDERRLRQRLTRNAEQRREIIESSLRAAGAGASWQLEELDAEDAEIRRQLGLDEANPKRTRKSSRTGWILLAAAVVLMFAIIVAMSIL